MVVKQITLNAAPEVKWIGCQEQKSIVSLPHLLYKNVCFYNRCIFGPQTFSVGDYVLVANADAAEPDTIAGCDVAKIVNLYELREMSDKDPCRAIVQWYSRPECVPHKEFDRDDICVDFNIEVVEEHRPYDADISLETVFRKCSVIIGRSEDSATGLLQQFEPKLTNICPMFVCRYKFIKIKNSYRLVPLTFVTDEIVKNDAKGRARSKKCIEDGQAHSAKGDSSKSSSAHKPKRLPVAEKRRRASVASASAVEFVDINYFSNENKVSPIKIVGGRSVVRAGISAKKQAAADSRFITSPLTEQNTKVTPRSRASSARRNLNISLDNGADSTADSDCLNYSIVKTPSDTQQPPNEMRIKLRLSGRRRSTKAGSTDADPLALCKSPEKDDQHLRKRCANIEDGTNDIYRTPSKKSKESSGTTEMTPSTRRKSILKSATSRLADGTPRRSIQLSSIVEKRIFQDDDVISTPKRGRGSKIKANNDDVSKEDSNIPKKTPQKTPTRNRHNSVKLNTESPNENATLTPSQKRKMIRSGEMNPAIEQRRTQATEGRKSDLQLAREQLHVSVVPKSLPCREKEFNNIYTFLEGKIEDQCGGCMYVSGVPGTGKTATVTGVIRSLQREVAEDKLPSFEFLEINGMRLTEPRQAYVQIYKQLTGKTVSWEHAHSLLEKRFTTPAPHRVTTVLLVDELDVLCNRRQDVVYNLLDWPTKSAARLVVVTIANTMDLPERLLMGKVTSRLGLTRLTFQPYTHKQLQEIVTARLSGSDAFKGDAVQLVARKVAAVSGDARRALDICRRATEIADATALAKNDGTPKKCVNMMHVQQALAEMISSAKVQSIKNCSRIEQLFLQAVVAEVTRTGVEETSFLGVYSQIETIAAFMSTSVPTPGRALRICSKLGSERLLICEHSRNDIFQKILLNVSMDDIHYALRVNSAT